MENNQIEIIGTVNSTFEYEYSAYGENFYSATVDIIRTSMAVDTIKIICSDRIFDVTEDLTGCAVSIVGSIRTYNQKGEYGSHLIINVFVDDMALLDVDGEFIGENQAYINGYICKKDSLRETPKGRTITDLIIAVNHRCGKSYYIPCIAWGRNAIYADKLNVGDEVYVSGRLQSREYIKNDEIKVAYELSIQTLEVVEEENA